MLVKAENYHFMKKLLLLIMNAHKVQICNDFEIHCLM